MRSFLRSFLTWLDKRFPEKVVITQVEFLTMKAQLDVLAKSLSEQRLKSMEAEINKFNVAMGFAGNISAKGLSQFQR